MVGLKRLVGLGGVALDWGGVALGLGGVSEDTMVSGGVHRLATVR